jgi:hypothetical protein
VSSTLHSQTNFYMRYDTCFRPLATVEHLRIIYQGSAVCFRLVLAGEKITYNDRQKQRNLCLDFPMCNLSLFLKYDHVTIRVFLVLKKRKTAQFCSVKTQVGMRGPCLFLCFAHFTLPATKFKNIFTKRTGSSSSPHILCVSLRI